MRAWALTNSDSLFHPTLTKKFSLVHSKLNQAFIIFKYAWEQYLNYRQIQQHMIRNIPQNYNQYNALDQRFILSQSYHFDKMYFLYSIQGLWNALTIHQDRRWLYVHHVQYLALHMEQYRLDYTFRWYEKRNSKGHLLCLNRVFYQASV